MAAATLPALRMCPSTRRCSRSIPGNICGHRATHHRDLQRWELHRAASRSMRRGPRPEHGDRFAAMDRHSLVVRRGSDDDPSNVQACWSETVGARTRVWCSSRMSCWRTDCITSPEVASTDFGRSGRASILDGLTTIANRASPPHPVHLLRHRAQLAAPGAARSSSG